MKKQEFLNLMKERKINLLKLLVTVDNHCLWEGFHGVYKKDDKWIFYIADGKRNTFEKVFENEEDAFEFLLKQVEIDLREKVNLLKNK